MRNQQWLYRRIVEEAGDAIIFADHEGIVRLWNSGAEATFGYSADEALGQTLDLIIPENLRERHWTGYRRVMETGVSRYQSDMLAVPAIRKGGKRISIEFIIIPLKDPDGRMLGMASIIRDVTARWEREKELKKQIAELTASKAQRE